MMKKCNTPAVSPLNAAVELTEDTKGCFKPGLGAFKGNERDKIVVPGSKYAKMLSQKKLVPVKQWNYSQL